jgi:cell division control protein 6
MARGPDYFSGGTRIFADKELLQVSHLPDGDRIIGRDEELSSLGSALSPALEGKTPNNAFLYGKTGTGKSLCTKFISTQMVDRAAKNGIRAGFAYVDCLQDSTETQAVQSAAFQLNREAETGISIPETGLSTAAYYKRLWNVIDTTYDVAIIILDEVDKLDGDDILMQLSRASESGKLTDSKLGVIGISNKIRYKDTLNERVKSSLCERDFVFPPYDANQLREILYSRADAFVDGVLDDAVIPRVSALAA